MPHFTQNILDALGWSLIHSVWQGGLACAAVMVMRAIWRGDNPAARYVAQCAVLTGCFAAFVFTFWMHAQAPAAPASDAVIITASAATIEIVTAPAGIINAAQTFAASPVNAGVMIPILGLLWCMGFAVMSLRYAGGLYLTGALRRNGLSAPSPQWVAAFKRLQIQSHIKRHVAFYISDCVKGPITLGTLKPVVLVPAAFLTALPKEQIEAILLHELAHIRRYDYAFNLVQTAIKTVFFYHPGVHYISRCIDTDREQACDDLAVSKSSNPIDLIKALAALPQGLTPQRLAMAANGPRHTPLLDRMTRLIEPKYKNRRPHGLGLLAMAVVLIGATSFSAVTQANSAQNTPQDDPQLAGPAPQVQNNVIIRGSQDLPKLPAAPSFPQFSSSTAIDAAEFGRRQSEIGAVWGSFRSDMSEFYNAYGQTKAANPSWDARMDALDTKVEHLEDRATKDFERAMEKSAQGYERYVDAKRRQDSAQERRNEAAQRRAEAQWERENATERRDEANQRRAEAQWERETAAERRAEAAERRAEAEERRQDAQLESEDARAMTLEARDAAKVKVKSADHKHFDKQKDYTALRDNLHRALKSDGLYIAGKDKQVIKIENAVWTVNGKPMPAKLINKYKDLIAASGIDMDEFVFAETSEDGLHISSHSVHGNDKQTRDITFGRFDHSDSTTTHRTVAAPQPPEPPSHTTHQASHSHGELPYYVASGLKITPQFLPPLSKLSVAAGHGEYIKLKDEYHSGTDFKAAVGTPVTASLDGTVIFADNSGNWGGLIKIKHAGGIQTKYASLGTFNVKVGDSVKAGQVIGTVGTIDDKWAPHLHFEILHNGHTYDPVYVLSQTQ